MAPSGAAEGPDERGGEPEPRSPVPGTGADLQTLSPHTPPGTEGGGAGGAPGASGRRRPPERGCGRPRRGCPAEPRRAGGTREPLSRGAALPAAGPLDRLSFHAEHRTGRRVRRGSECFKAPPPFPSLPEVPLGCKVAFAFCLP